MLDRDCLEQLKRFTSLIFLHQDPAQIKFGQWRGWVSFDDGLETQPCCIEIATSHQCQTELISDPLIETAD